MKEIKYRIPVRCQNGHKVFWYCYITNDRICEHEWALKDHKSGVLDAEKCECSKIGSGEGYTRNGIKLFYKTT